MRRTFVVATLLLVAGVVFYFWPKSAPVPGGAGTGSRGVTDTNVTPADAQKPRGPQRGSSDSGATQPFGPAKSNASGSYVEADYPIAAPLNAPSSNIAQDLDVLQRLFEAWQSNFPREGNPVGENAEIAAALMGDNRLGLALVPKGHRAVNERGELCDRWGTPFRFHQLSGTKMEIRSAGPDRKFATEDDAVWTPE
jgi:hypothetical protein